MPSERITHTIVSRLLTTHPKLLVALVALVGFVALQGSAAAAETVVCEFNGFESVVDLIDLSSDSIEVCNEEGKTTNPGP